MKPSSSHKSELTAHLARHGQQHLLAFWDELSPEKQQSLAHELHSVDLELIGRLHRGDARPSDWAELARRSEPPPSFRWHDTANAISCDQARERGWAALAAGEVGAVLVAGGQGSRLGFEHPKGMYPIGPVSNAPLFQVLLEKILARSRASGRPIPLYLMTSPATDAETRTYLADKNYFGLPAEDVVIFCQGTMPAVDAQSGRILLAAKDCLCLSPDGHGGTVAALDRHGALDDIERRGLKYLFYFQVDNPLVPVCDPEFLGYHILAGSEMSSLVVRKRTPRDRVGNVVSIDGRLQVLEYSDFNPLPDELVDRRTQEGQPIFWAGSIAVHVLDAAFLRRAVADAASLPFHVAHKSVSHIAADGTHVEAKQPNAYKFERFIFDLMPLAERAIVVEVEDREAFAPLKNASGQSSDTPEHVREQWSALHREWLRAAGVQIDDTTPVEIPPLFAQDAAELSARVKPGTSPTHFQQRLPPARS